MQQKFVRKGFCVRRYMAPWGRGGIQKRASRCEYAFPQLNRRRYKQRLGRKESSFRIVVPWRGFSRPGGFPYAIGPCKSKQLFQIFFILEGGKTKWEGMRLKLAFSKKKSALCREGFFCCCETQLPASFCAWVLQYIQYSSLAALLPFRGDCAFCLVGC